MAHSSAESYSPPRSPPKVKVQDDASWIATASQPAVPTEPASSSDRAPPSAAPLTPTLGAQVVAQTIEASSVPSSGTDSETEASSHVAPPPAPPAARSPSLARLARSLGQPGMTSRGDRCTDTSRTACAGQLSVGHNTDTCCDDDSVRRRGRHALGPGRAMCLLPEVLQGGVHERIDGACRELPETQGDDMPIFPHSRLPCGCGPGQRQGDHPAVRTCADAAQAFCPRPPHPRGSHEPPRLRPSHRPRSRSQPSAERSAPPDSAPHPL